MVLKEIPVDLKTEAPSKEISHFAVGFCTLSIRDGVEYVQSTGSGTLVRVGSISGILTAAHVLKALPKKGKVGLSFVVADTSGFRRRFIEMEHAETLTITGSKFQPGEPDLGFLRLPAESVAWIEATNSFYNLDKHVSEALSNVAIAPNYFDAVTGIIDERTKVLPSEKPRTRLTEFESMFCDGKIAESFDVGSNDYFNIKLNEHPDFHPPSSFEGLSGGAVWRFYVTLNDGKPSIVGKRLIGIPFFQSPPSDNGIRIITCHGVKSIYGVLVANIAAKWVSDVATSDEPGRDFIREIVAGDLASGKVKEVVTRFPPEPNGYLHIGHAKSICLNFGIAQEFGGRCHLRFDDTNPTKEEQEYIDAIERDVRWLGFDWGQHLYFASDYFERLYGWAVDLIRAGKAYVDDQSQEEMRANRGTLTEPGKNSPFRDRSVEENLDLFARMRAGEFPNGARVLRAKIDMASGNINLRDPVLYRILHAEHPRTGTAWKIYPSYDFAHGQSDAIEGITHSICTLEFEDHRPLYDWFIENLSVPSKPHQYEFARLNLTYTLLSKRVLTRLVQDKHVAGWDDPRMPTIAGFRRRGVPPEAIRDFVKRIGVAKANSTVDAGMFDFSVREALNKTALRRMAVLKPLKIVIENYPEGQVEELEAVNHPDDPAAGSRKIKFARELYIEQDDFMLDPPKKFFRLSPGKEVRLRYAYFITCREAVKNAAGDVIELRCTYDPATKGGNAPDGRKVKATIHWVSAAHALPAEVRIYNPLFNDPEPSADAETFAAGINPNSLEVLKDARLEPALSDVKVEVPVQFERQGYFCRDRDSTADKLVFTRTIGLRDTYAKDVAKEKAGSS